MAIKEKYIKNTILLSICMLVTKFIGALYKIPLSNILGTSGIGLYQMVFPVYSLFLVFITGALPTYISQKVSIFRAKNDYKSINSLLKNSVLLCLIVGVLFSAILILLSKQIAILQGNINAYLGYVIVAISIIFSFLTSIFKGCFWGYEDMWYPAICGVIEQIVKLVIGLSLAYVLKGYGIIFAFCGAFFGVLGSEIVGFIFIIFAYKSKRKQKVKVYYNFKEVKSILTAFLPISLGGLILPFSSAIDSFLVINLLLSIGIDINIATSLFGIATGMIGALINFPIVLLGTICTAILPSITNKLARNESVEEQISGVYYYIWLICIPCVFGIISLAPNIIEVFFPAIEIMYTNVSSYYLSLSAFNIIWLSILQVSTSVLNSYSKFKLPLISQSIGLVVKSIILVVLILFTNLNIISLALAMNFGNLIACLINLSFVKKITTFSINPKKLALVLFSGVVMFFVVSYFNNLFVMNEFLQVIVLTIIGCLVYLVMNLMFKTFSIKQIKNLVFGKKI